MATPENIEYLRQCAHEEQLNAAYEQRKPDREFLDQLGSLVIREGGAVACVTETAYYIDFDPKEGHKIEELSRSVPVSGFFGGFWVQPINIDHGVDGVVNAHTVNYFILDTTYKDVGFICPVESTKLKDVEKELENDDDYASLHAILSEEFIDIDEIGNFFKRPLERSKMGLYIAYLRSAVTPSQIIEAVYTEGMIGIDSNDTVRPYYGIDVYREAINKTDVFTVGNFTHQVGTELAIRRGRNPTFYFPLSFITGHDIIGR